MRRMEAVELARKRFFPVPHSSMMLFLTPSQSAPILLTTTSALIAPLNIFYPPWSPSSSKYRGTSRETNKVNNCRSLSIIASAQADLDLFKSQIPPMTNCSRTKKMQMDRHQRAHIAQVPSRSHPKHRSAFSKLALEIYTNFLCKILNKAIDNSAHWTNPFPHFILYFTSDVKVE